MTLHNRMTAFSFAAVVALAALLPSAPATAAEEVGLQEECVPSVPASASTSVARCTWSMTMAPAWPATTTTATRTG